MQELLTYIVKNILGEGVDFQINQHDSEAGLEFQIQLPDELCGKLIGKGGQTIKAIRDVVNIIARRENRRIFIKVNA
jgi:predicted RNA-binding protein YlqC (UPF0109 family)